MEALLQIDRIDVFFRQRDNLFHPAWAFVLPTTLIRLPISFVESLTWLVIVYFEAGLAPQPGR